MDSREGGDHGLTLVGLMVVVLIIGILVAIAVPVFTRTRLPAEARSCRANQRTISGAANLVIADGDDYGDASAGQLVPSGSGWYGILVPAWIEGTPLCATGNTPAI